MRIEELTQKTSHRGSVYFEDSNGEVVAKKCNGCDEIKALQYYAKQKNSIAGRMARCRRCRKSDNENHRANNKEYHAERGRIYRQTNKERNRSYGAQYRKNNPDIFLLAGYLSRARSAGLVADFTNEQHAYMLDHFNGGCALTGGSSKIHVDHVIPLSIGVSGSSIGNMVPMSSSLNISKSNRHVFEWFDANCDRLNLDRARFDRMVEYLAHHNDMTPAEYRSYVDECYANKSAVN